MPGQARQLQLSQGFPRPRPQLAPGSTAPGTSCCPGTAAWPGRGAKPGLKPWARAVPAVQQGICSLPGCSPRRARCRAWCRRAGRSGGTSRTRFPARRRPRLRAGGWTSPAGRRGAEAWAVVAARKGPRAHPPSLGLPRKVSEQLVSVSEAFSEDRRGVRCNFRGRLGPSAVLPQRPTQGPHARGGSIWDVLVAGGHWLGGKSSPQAQIPLNKAFFWDKPRKMHLSCMLSPRTEGIPAGDPALAAEPGRAGSSLRLQFLF